MVLPEQSHHLPATVQAPAAVLREKPKLLRPKSWPFWLCLVICLGLVLCAWFLPPLLLLPPCLLAFKAWQYWRQERWWRAVVAGLTALAVAGGCGLMGAGMWMKAELEQAAYRAQDQENVRIIIGALAGWRAEHQAYPAELLPLVRDGWLPWPTLISPWHRGKPHPGKSDYQYQRLADGQFLLKDAKGCPVVPGLAGH